MEAPFFPVNPETRSIVVALVAVVLWLGVICELIGRWLDR